MAFQNPFRRPALAPDPTGSAPDVVAAKDLQDAYQRGRRDASRDRKRHPAGMTFLFAAAIVGVAVLAYAVYSGSFATGGQRLDRDLAVAADRAGPMARDAAHAITERKPAPAEATPTPAARP